MSGPRGVNGRRGVNGPRGVAQFPIPIYRLRARKRRIKIDVQFSFLPEFPVGSEWGEDRSEMHAVLNTGPLMYDPTYISTTEVLPMCGHLTRLLYAGDSQLWRVKW